MILTEDNHDARAWISKRKFPFQIVPELLLDRVAIPHDPTALSTGSLGIVGHLHPGARSAESPRFFRIQRTTETNQLMPALVMHKTCVYLLDKARR